MIDQIREMAKKSNKREKEIIKQERKTGTVNKKKNKRYDMNKVREKRIIVASRGNKRQVGTQWRDISQNNLEQLDEKKDK